MMLSKSKTSKPHSQSGIEREISGGKVYLTEGKVLPTLEVLQLSWDCHQLSPTFPWKVHPEQHRLLKLTSGHEKQE